ncbi:hypothetical protein OH77DRAFT_1419926 [Trametes cingulata]|nr:hypothetical protein OH77DRAFT_1419926 [Trametes cingulata]
MQIEIPDTPASVPSTKQELLFETQPVLTDQSPNSAYTASPSDAIEPAGPEPTSSSGLPLSAPAGPCPLPQPFESQPFHEQAESTPRPANPSGPVDPLSNIGPTPSSPGLSLGSPLARASESQPVPPHEVHGEEEPSLTLSNSSEAAERREYAVRMPAVAEPLSPPAEASEVSPATGTYPRH